MKEREYYGISQINSKCKEMEALDNMKKKFRKHNFGR
jgi:hypothetical protein